MGSDMQLRPKHVELACDNSSPSRVKMGSSVLSKPKQAGIGCNSLSPRRVKVNPSTLPGPKHVGIRSGSSGLRGGENGFRRIGWSQTCWLGVHSRARAHWAQAWKS